MADPTPTPAPEPTPPKTSKRGPSNQAWLDELTAAEAVLNAAAPADRAAQLATGGIGAATLNALGDAIPAARTLAGRAVQSTTNKLDATDDETDLATDLINKIQEVQKRARQKYAATDKVRLKDYAVGQPFYSSRSLLEQAAAGVLDKLAPAAPAGGGAAPAADVLPGISAAKIAALKQSLADYQNVQGEQTGAQGDATTARKQLDLLINGPGGIVAQRRQIQFAADAEWPHTDPANAGIRAEFQLPPNRVFK